MVWCHLNLKTGDNTCTICLDNIGKKSCELTCKHSFHPICALKWFQINGSCPLCREPVEKDAMLLAVVNFLGQRWNVQRTPSRALMNAAGNVVYCISSKLYIIFPFGNVNCNLACISGSLLNFFFKEIRK
jgi:hypothetical protein